MLYSTHISLDCARIILFSIEKHLSFTIHISLSMDDSISGNGIVCMEKLLNHLHKFSKFLRFFRVDCFSSLNFCVCKWYSLCTKKTRKIIIPSKTSEHEFWISVYQVSNTQTLLEKTTHIQTRSQLFWMYYVNIHSTQSFLLKFSLMQESTLSKLLTAAVIQSPCGLMPLAVNIF